MSKGEVSELLKPRYKVIADFPGNMHPIGMIIGLFHDSAFFEKYPHLYKKLAWYEEREASEMPEYVKDKHNKFHWVRRWEISEDEETGETDVVAYFDKSYMAHHDWLPDQLDLVPATETEYQLYLCKQEQEEIERIQKQCYRTPGK